MTSFHAGSETSLLEPTRRLSTAERRVFDQIRGDFVHLVASDAEMLTQYAEAAARYQTAAKETKKNPTVSMPVVNRASGNVVGEKIVRNPAFVTLKEAQSQMNALARRLMIDPASAEKRQRLLTKKARALVAAEQAAASNRAERQYTEAEIAAMEEELLSHAVTLRGEALRNAALQDLKIRADNAAWAHDDDLADLLA